jgi:hypothetical protein
MIPENSQKNPKYHKPHLVKITVDSLYNTMFSPEVYIHAGFFRLSETSGIASCAPGRWRAGQSEGAALCRYPEE